MNITPSGRARRYIPTRPSTSGFEVAVRIHVWPSCSSVSMSDNISIYWSLVIGSAVIRSLICWARRAKYGRPPMGVYGSGCVASTYSMKRSKSASSESRCSGACCALAVNVNDMMAAARIVVRKALFIVCSV